MLFIKFYKSTNICFLQLHVLIIGRILKLISLHLFFILKFETQNLKKKVKSYHKLPIFIMYLA